MKGTVFAPRRDSDANSRDVFALGFVLCLVQLLDGFLTGIGVYHYGSNAEANIVIKKLMVCMGPFHALLTVKTLSIAVVYYICRIGRSIVWLREALEGVIAIYLHCAILPWAIFIGSRLM